MAETSEHHEDIDADAIFAELETEEDRDILELRSQRVQATNHLPESSLAASTTRNVYVTLVSDDETLQFTTEHEKAIVHFFHPDFARCGIMDEHLTKIAQQQYGFGVDTTEEDVKFARVDVKHADFVVQKLGIRVLPCVVGFATGQIMGRIVGFEGVSWSGTERGLAVTRAIEEKFVDWKLLRRALVRRNENDDSSSDEENNSRNGRRGITGRKQNVTDEDDDWD